ncbi:longitudinals lacking protein, isoforms A/B/D/L isoform X2 [Agrilus planipennis]|uniref:Longitudinals lacking protein, isoforms A/B/D/L isoform X2 n=1 Tax=Agrilus planipennis TaxID=224129 RepID=A0A1W4XK56_AGRPL|nr:longitudinals lacking protein, isoforms A/B/D/L isoform X2 [Agrilus planipennis]
MDDDQQFCLRWNNHQSTLVAVFDTLLENGTLVDCTLAAEGKFLNAHKVVLSACSPYFETLLSQNYDKHPIFILKDVKFQELKAMMDYMYRGEVNISQDQLGALLKAAESLQIKGLSDNRKGESETKKTVVPPPAKSPTPQTSTIPKVQGLTIEQRKSRDFDDTREGSQSPGPRKRKRIRRKSTDDLDNHQDASNSSESHSSQAPPVQNIPSSLPAASTIANVPEPIETKSEILTRHKTSVASNESDLSQVPIIKEKIETHSEIMLEPKSEYVEEMNEEESIEDLTLDDDDLSNMELSGNQGAGPSHGNAGEGSSQGFGNWHMGNQNQDEVFLAAQEAVGAHRDSQAQDLRINRPWQQWPTHLTLPMFLMRETLRKTMLQSVGRSSLDLTITPASKSPRNVNRLASEQGGGVGGFDCPDCGRTYKLKSSLRNHQKWECGKEPQFKCPYCIYKAKQKMHMARHMERMHKEIDYSAVKMECNVKNENPEAE